MTLIHSRKSVNNNDRPQELVERIQSFVPVSKYHVPEKEPESRRTA